MIPLFDFTAAGQLQQVTYGCVRPCNQYTGPGRYLIEHHDYTGMPVVRAVRCTNVEGYGLILVRSLLTGRHLYLWAESELNPRILGFVELAPPVREMAGG